MKGIHVWLSVFFFCVVTMGLLGCSGAQTKGEIHGTVSYVVDSTISGDPTVVTVSAIDHLSATVSVDTLPPRPIPPNPPVPIPFTLRCDVPGQYRIRLDGTDFAGNPWQAYYRSPGGISMLLPDATPIVLDQMNPVRSGVDIEIPVRP